MNPEDQDDWYATAGEYALGLLADDEKARFEEALATNPALATAVAWWNDRLLDLVPETSPVSPSASLWGRIEGALPRPHEASSQADLRPGTQSPERSGSLWQNLGFWRWLSAGGVLASVFLALRLMTGTPDAASLQYVAVLQAREQGVDWLVEVRGKSVHLRPLSPVKVSAGKSLQFWTKPEGAPGPTSLGLVAPDRVTTVALERLPGISPNQLFEVTLEPAAGSPLDRPTGPILALGKAARL